MGDEISIDTNIFHDRLSAFLNQWKNDKRSGDVLFNGADSIVLLVGKASESGIYNKTTAFQVSVLSGFELIISSNECSCGC